MGKVKERRGGNQRKKGYDADEERVIKIKEGSGNEEQLDGRDGNH